METSKLICYVNQLTAFYMMATLAFNDLISKVIENNNSLSKIGLSLKKWTAVKLPIRLSPNHSTDTCLSQLTEVILNGLENDWLHTDFNWSSKDYWRLRGHKILLEKINCIGFSDKTIKRFHFYLTNRPFSISFDNISLETRTRNSGVLQGSILIPYLFL